VSLRDVSMFLTGSPYVSKTDSIGVYFQHDKIGRMTISTCNLEIYIPVSATYTGDNFSNNIVFDIINSPGFGCV